MSRKIDSEFKGYRGVCAYHYAQTPVRSIYYLPVCKERDYFKTLEWFDTLNEDDKRKYIKTALDEGALLNEEEINLLCSFAYDNNDVPYTKEALKNLDGLEIQDIVLDVCCEIYKKRVFFYQMNK